MAPNGAVIKIDTTAAVNTSVPHARYYNKEIKSEKRRQKLECYWANLSSDISYISSRYNY